MDMFGLGILLNAKDQASASIYRVNTALQGLMSSMNEAGEVSETQMNRITQSMQSATNLLERGLQLTSLGGEIANFGTSLVQPLVAVGQQALSTGSQFEQWRMTLNALYKDSTLATQKANEAMQLAAKTPFEVTDVMEALIGFKAIGAEALTVMDNVEGATDQTRTFLEYVGDLASLRPDVGLNGVLLGIRNLLGGDGGKSLKMIMDIDFEQIMGEDWKDTPEEIMQQIANVSQQIAGGLMEKLEGTWSQMISNLEDQTTRFFLAIADNGAFDSFKNSLKYISDAIASIDDERMANIGKNIANAFTMIWTPIDFVIRKLTDFGMAIVNLVETSPLISKLVVGFISLAGVSAIVLGGLVVLSGAFLLLQGALRVVQTAFASLGPIMLSFKTKLISMSTALIPLLPKIALLTSAVALLYKGWKSDFGGIRTTLTNFVSNTRSAFKDSSDIASMSVNDMMNALNNLNQDTWYGRLTYNLTKLKVFWMGLCDAWNDYELSDENFQKLNALGLLPLLGTILDIKMRAEAFFEGFKEGWKNVFNTVSPIISSIIQFIKDIVIHLLPAKDKVDEFQNSAEGLNTQPWYDLGEAIAYFTSILAGIWAVSKIVGLVTTVSSAIGGVVSFILGIPSAIGGVLSTIWGAISSLGGVIATALGWVGGLVTAILGAFGIVVTLPAWIVGLITVAVAGVLALVIKYRDKVWEALKVVGGWIKDGISLVCQVVAGIVSSTVLAIIGIVMTIVTVVSTVVGLIATVVGTLVGVVTTIVLGIVALFQMGCQLISGLFSTLIALVGTIIASIVGIVSPIIAIVVGLFQTGFAVIESVVRTFCAIAKAVFTGDFTSLSETLKSIWSNLGSRIQEIWNNVTSTISNIWNSIGSFMSNAWDNLGQKWSSVMDNIKSIASGTVETVKSVWNGITGFFSGIWDGIMSSASSMFSWLADKFSWVTNSINTVKGWFGGGDSSGSSSKKSSKMVGLNTGGYVKTEGVAMLHPNEVVVNDDLTQRLRTFLSNNEGQSNISNARMVTPNINVEPVITPNIVINMPERRSSNPPSYAPSTNNNDMGKVIPLSNYTNTTLEDIVHNNTSNYNNSRSLVNNYSNTDASSLVNNITNENEIVKNLVKNIYEENVKHLYSNISNISEDKSILNSLVTNNSDTLNEGTVYNNSNNYNTENNNSNSTLTNNNSSNTSNIFRSLSTINNSTNNTTNNGGTSNAKIDNSITFSEGAIQITMTNGNDADIDKLVRQIATKLKKEANLRSTLNYKPLVG